LRAKLIKKTLETKILIKVSAVYVKKQISLKNFYSILTDHYFFKINLFPKNLQSEYDEPVKTNDHCKKARDKLNERSPGA